MLPGNKQNQAFKKHTNVENKMDNNEKVLEDYCNKMEGYVKKGYAKKFEGKLLLNNHERIWYLPHFYVINLNKSSKICLVFDASVKANGAI